MNRRDIDRLADEFLEECQMADMTDSDRIAYTRGVEDFRDYLIMSTVRHLYDK